MGKVPDFIVLQSGAWRHLVEDKANIIAHRRHVPPSPVTVKKLSADPIGNRRTDRPVSRHRQ